MTKVYFLLFSLSILLFAGCTKNNQNSPANFAYLNVNETFVSTYNGYKAYDIDNDGVVDWAFEYRQNSNPVLAIVEGGLGNNTSAIVDSVNANGVRILQVGVTIQNTSTFHLKNTFPYVFELDYFSINNYILGSGDFYIGFKSQNPQFTNTFFGWARLNLSADGNTLIVKDMALNTVNGGSINVGQH